MSNRYKHVLEKGEALKKFYELTEEDRIAISERIFEKVSKLAKQYGHEVITGDTVGKKMNIKNNASEK